MTDPILYLLAMLPGIALCFVEDLGPIVGIPAALLGLLVLPYSATLSIVIAVAFVMWCVGMVLYSFVTGKRI